MWQCALIFLFLLSSARGQASDPEVVARPLTADEVAGFVPWARDARTLLLQAQKDALALPVIQRQALLEERIRRVVRESGERRYQTHMRYALNRGLLLAGELRERADTGTIGVAENVADLLRRAINIGLAFHQSDLEFQQGVAPATPPATFAAVFVRTMAPGVANVLHEAAQYRLLRKLVEMTAWDLAHSSDAKAFAELIVETQELLGVLPEDAVPQVGENRRGIQRMHRLGVLTLAIPAAQGAVLECLQVLRRGGIADDVGLDYCVHQEDSEVISCVATLTRVRELPTEQAYRGCATSPRPAEHTRCVMMFSHTWDIEDRRIPPEISQQFCHDGLSTPVIQCADTLLRVEYAQGRTFHETLRARNLERIDRLAIARECGRIKSLDGHPADVDLRSFQFTSCVLHEINYTRRRDKGGPEIFEQCAEWLELVNDPTRPVEGVGTRQRPGR
jgi:hypothetical protein